MKLVGADVEDVAKGNGKRSRGLEKLFYSQALAMEDLVFRRIQKRSFIWQVRKVMHFSQLKETIAINDYQQELLVKKADKSFFQFKREKELPCLVFLSSQRHGRYERSAIN